MKTSQEPTFVETSNVGETRRASIRASATMFNLLSKQIYSNFFVAIWRELVANAVDAQKVIGETRPPIVTVPSMLEPHATVRDFGTGMSHDFMMEKFMQFGDASTKETSNDFIGGFGIGSKAPLAYTEQYSVKCYQNGEVRVYSIFKDDEGCPSIAFLSKSDTTEPDGVEVSFPVRQDDIYKFSDAVVDTLKYFDPLPVLENTELKLEPVEYDVKGKNWGMRITSNPTASKIIVGGVAYPLDHNQISYEYSKLRNFGSKGLDIYLDIGEVDISASRESVVHDSTLLTKLEKIIEGIEPEIGKQLSKQFNSCKTAWEAKKRLNTAMETCPHTLRTIIQRHAVWNGDKIAPRVLRPKGFEVTAICYGSFGYNSGIYALPTTEAISPKFRAWPEHGGFTPNTFDKIVYDDSPDKPSLRIRTVIDTFPQERILFIRDIDPLKDIEWDKFFKALGSPPKSMISKLSAYAPMKIVRSTSGSSTRPFKCYPYGPYRGSRYLSELPKGGGVYVEMDNFSIIPRGSDVEVAKLLEPKNLIYLNKTDFQASGIESMAEWISVEDAIKKVKSDYRSKHNRLAEAEAAWVWTHGQSRYGLPNWLEKLSKLKNFPKRGPLYQLSKLLELHKEVMTREHHLMRSEVLKIDYESHLKKIQKMEEDANSKHPALSDIVKNLYYGSTSVTDRVLNRLF